MGLRWVQTVLRYTEEMGSSRDCASRVCLAGLANWVSTTIFVAAGSESGDGPATRFTCTPRPAPGSSSRERAQTRQI